MSSHRSTFLFHYKALLCALLLATLVPSVAHADLKSDFEQPPDTAKPWTYWFWINGNITREGITADLEAMAHAGIGGVLIMEVANPKSMAPVGPVVFAGPEWRELYKHVVAEAGRLHLQVNMNNDAGWCGSGGPWITPELSMQKLIATTTTITGGQRFEGKLPQPKAKLGYYRDIKVFAMPHHTGGDSTTQTVARESIVDVSDKMQPDGQFVWDAPPAGQWEVMRIGCTTTGQINKPAPDTGEGLECDKFSAEALKKHFDGLISKLCDDTSSAVGTVFTTTHIDSWEVGTQDWTAHMADEFRKRRGYDVGPWLALLASGAGNVVIGTADETERFRRDYRRTCSELVDEAYAGAMRDAAHARGLKLSIEAYGGAGFLNPLTYGAQADLPMAEFWINRWGAWHLLSPRLLASVAHVFGKSIVGAESFTADAKADPFTEHPYSIKTTGDWAFSEGINRFVFHRTALNPWPKLKPGMSFAGYGWHADPAQPWWDSAGKAFFQYVARCQAVLQQGDYVADVCRLVLDGGDYGQRGTMERLPRLYEPVPAGYAYDYVSDTALLAEFSVKDGRLVSRSGKTTYRVLQLPNSQELTPELLRKLRDLVKAGAIVVGPRPGRSQSLQNFPECDHEVKSLADELWESSTAEKTASNGLGAGQVIWGLPIAKVLEDAVGVPDLAFALNPSFDKAALRPPSKPANVSGGGETTSTMPTAGLNWIHRRTSDGQEAYFVANPQYRAVDALCTFRVKARKPEFWNPATGEIQSPAAFREAAGGTVVPIHFDPAGSVFVVFGEKANPAKQVVELTKDKQVLLGSSQQKPVALPNLCSTTTGTQMLEATPGHYDLKYADGHHDRIVVAAPPSAIALDGPWKVEFQKDWGAPAGPVEFPTLVDWSKHSDEGIRHFSGTATYRTEFTHAAAPDAASLYMLSLGEVHVAAAVSLNGIDLGILWKEPYTLDITSALKSGTNQLEVKVSNQWPNRLIGDEQYADDCTTNSKWKTGRLPAWPEWLLKNTTRPEPRRLTFTTYKYYTKDSPLQPSGLVGPVQIISESVHSKAGERSTNN